MSFRSKDRDRIKAGMIEEATELFAQRGLKKTTVDEIVQRVSIAKGTFYLYFKNKEELFFRCLEAVEAYIDEREIKPLMRNLESPEYMIKELMTLAVDLPNLYPFMKVAADPQTMAILTKKLDPEILKTHLKKDLDDTKEMFQFWESLGWQSSMEPAVFNGMIQSFIFMSMHRQEIGEIRFPAVQRFMIEALSQKAAQTFYRVEEKHD